MSLQKRIETQYLTGNQKTARFSRNNTVFLPVLFIVFAVMFLATSIAGMLFLSENVAYAEGEDKIQEKIKESADDYIPESEEGEEGNALFPTLEKMQSEEDGTKADSTSFAYILNRMFSIHYLNDTSGAYTPSGVEEKRSTM